MDAETWRAVTESGREIAVTVRRGHPLAANPWEAWIGGSGAGGASRLAAVSHVVASCGDAAREILGPGELTRAELVAERDRLRVALDAALDVGCETIEAARRTLGAAEGEALGSVTRRVATERNAARRKGVEAMRAACKAALIERAAVLHREGYSTATTGAWMEAAERVEKPPAPTCDGGRDG